MKSEPKFWDCNVNNLPTSVLTKELLEDAIERLKESAGELYSPPPKQWMTSPDSMKILREEMKQRGLEEMECLHELTKEGRVAWDLMFDAFFVYPKEIDG